MEKYQLENEVLSVEVNSFGAELSSIVKKSTGAQYLWNGDSAYWGRQSPVLFPLVGQVRDQAFRVDGVTYPMGQHGFARDMEFQFESQTADSITFSLTSNEETLKKFPYAFKLSITYVLSGATLRVIWKVENPGKKALDFSVGGHPAFMCPLGGGEQTSCYIDFHKPDQLLYSQLENGVVAKKGLVLDTCGGMMPIGPHLFDGDALIFEDAQLSEVSLAGPDQRDYLTVKFTSPLVGIWSPVGKHAPFVCIEPWYGRSDDASFTGEWKDREYGNSIQPGEVFQVSYDIVIA